MARWQIALALLVFAALAHIIGVVRQIRHYRLVFGELGARWKDCRIGVGAAEGGVIAIVVLDQAGRVQAVQVRQGRGIFGKFEPRDDLLQMEKGALREKIGAREASTSVSRALSAALNDMEAKEAEPAS